MPEHERTETPLQMSLRHVNEGRARIARQEQVIADLERNGHDHMLPEANKMLEQMRKLQGQIEEELASRRAESVGDKPD